MKCKVKNISGGMVEILGQTLQKNEEATINFTEQVRRYVARGFIKLIDFYPGEPLNEPPVHRRKRRSKSKHKSNSTEEENVEETGGK